MKRDTIETIMDALVMALMCVLLVVLLHLEPYISQAIIEWKAGQMTDTKHTPEGEQSWRF
jgi:hypothetical protein